MTILIRLAPVLALCLATPSEPAPDDDPDAAFRKMLAEARSDPDAADFRKLRLAFAKTSAYQPYSKDEFDPSAVEHERKNGERAAAMQALDQALQGYWVDPWAHAYAADLCEMFDEDERATMHRKFMKELLDAILEGRDGRSFEKAWPVLSVREEYLILDALGLDRPHNQALVGREGHYFDVHTFEGDEPGRELKLHFNIDVPHAWLRKGLRNED